MDSVIQKSITKYNSKLEDLKSNCINISSDGEFRELFKGVIVLFIKDVVGLYNKILTTKPDFKNVATSEKITNLNILLECLEGDGKLYGIDCNDIILRAYIKYFYVDYRDTLMNWDIESVKQINETNFRKAVVNTATKEQVNNSVSEYLNIIPELVTMINNCSDKDILKILYLLNNVNTIIDVYLYKKPNL
jgi:hypothetical protein